MEGVTWIMLSFLLSQKVLTSMGYNSDKLEKERKNTISSITILDLPTTQVVETDLCFLVVCGDLISQRKYSVESLQFYADGKYPWGRLPSIISLHQKYMQSRSECLDKKCNPKYITIKGTKWTDRDCV